MRFVCDHCKSKYSIADEKIRGKTMRMACRKCGHVLTIRGEGSEAHLSAPPPTVEEKIAAQIAESIHPGGVKEKAPPMPVVPKAPAAPRIGTPAKKVPTSAASAPLPAKSADASGSTAKAPESGPQSKPKPADASGANKSAVVKKPALPPKMPASATATKPGGVAAEPPLTKTGENAAAKTGENAAAKTGEGASAPIAARVDEPAPKPPIAEAAPPPPPSTPKPVVIPPSMPIDEDDDGDHRSALPPAPRDLPHPTSTAASELRAAAPKPASVRPVAALLAMPTARESDEPPQRLTLEGLKAASSASRETAMLFPLGFALGLFIGVIAGVFVMKKQMGSTPAPATSASAIASNAPPPTADEIPEELFPDEDGGLAPKPKTPPKRPTPAPTATGTIGGPTPTPTASTSVEAPRILPLTQSRADGFVTSYLARAKRGCVEKHPEALPATIVLQLSINPDGSVASANVNQTEGLHVIGDCILRGATVIHFPASTEGLASYQTTIHY